MAETNYLPPSMRKQPLLSPKIQKPTSPSNPEPQNPSMPSNQSTRFRPHSDVLNRIIYDPSYDPSKYVIGYLDRFDGITETSITDWMERREVAHEEFVPGHRIVFFKRISGSGLDADDNEDGNAQTKNKRDDDSLIKRRKGQVEEEWDGTLIEDVEWDEWNKRGVNPKIDISGDGKIPGEIVWDRRKRIDLIFSGQ